MSKNAQVEVATTLTDDLMPKNDVFKFTKQLQFCTKLHQLHNFV